MAVNKLTGYNARKGAGRRCTQLKTKMQGEERWTKRTTASRQFLHQKKNASAEPFNGVRKEKAR